MPPTLVGEGLLPQWILPANALTEGLRGRSCGISQNDYGDYLLRWPNSDWAEGSLQTERSLWDELKAWLPHSASSVTQPTPFTPSDVTQCTQNSTQWPFLVTLAKASMSQTLISVENILSMTYSGSEILSSPAFTVDINSKETLILAMTWTQSMIHWLSPMV